jgi:hypothetical protein
MSSALRSGGPLADGQLRWPPSRFGSGNRSEIRVPAGANRRTSTQAHWRVYWLLFFLKDIHYLLLPGSCWLCAVQGRGSKQGAAD